MSKVFLKDGKWTSKSRKPIEEKDVHDEKQKYHKESYDKLMRDKASQLNALDESDPDYENKAKRLEKRLEILNKMRKQNFPS